MREKSLEFEMYDDENRHFFCTFESESAEKNVLMSVIFCSLPLDITDIQTYDPQLMKNIVDNMRETAKNSWDKEETTHA